MEYPFVYAPGLISASFSMYYTTQRREHTGMGQVFTIARVEYWNIVQVKMLC